MCKKVCEVYFLRSKAQHEEGQKAVKSRRHTNPLVLRVGDSPNTKVLQLRVVVIAGMQLQPQNQFCLCSALIPDE